MSNPTEVQVFERDVRDAPTPNRVFESLDKFLSLHGATHVLITGLPMPGRAVEPLIHHLEWPLGGESKLSEIPKDDPVLERCRVSRRPFRLTPDALPRPSALMVAAVGEGATEIVAVPIETIPSYQACLLAAGRGMSLSELDLRALDFLCDQAFRRLRTLRHFSGQRPGDLSARERRVLELSASGKTAQDIADLLHISQRTVHAHLQNAGEKLQASNKTQTVVEALRYRQIELRESDDVFRTS